MNAITRIYLRATPEQKATIKQSSEHLGVSMSEFILSCAYEKAIEVLKENPSSKNDMLLIDFMAQLPPLESFKNIDAVELQREWRSEWDRTGE